MHSLLRKLSIEDVRQHYEDRREIRMELKSLIEEKQAEEYFDLALGISDCRGNYSAVEHGHGPRILEHNTNAIERVFRLGKELQKTSKPIDVTTKIRKSQLSYLKISVGSEMALMLRPEKFWVANTRSVWTHLVMKHIALNPNDSVSKAIIRANEELKLYREDDYSSEMRYDLWEALFLEMEESMDKIIEIGAEWAEKKGLRYKRPRFKYLWADGICNSLYEYYA